MVPSQQGGRPQILNGELGSGSYDRGVYTCMCARGGRNHMVNHCFHTVRCVSVVSVCVNEKLLRNFRESCGAEARKNERKVAVNSNESLAQANRRVGGGRLG